MRQVDVPPPKPTGVGNRLRKVPVRYQRASDEGFRPVKREPGHA